MMCFRPRKEKARKPHAHPSDTHHVGIHNWLATHRAQPSKTPTTPSPPLNVPKLTTLPIYEAHASEAAAAKSNADAVLKHPTNVRTRTRPDKDDLHASSTAAPPNQHHSALQSQREAPNVASLHQQLQHPRRSSSSLASWSPPSEWGHQANHSAGSLSSRSHSIIMNGQSVESLPAGVHRRPSYFPYDQKSLPPVPRQSIIDRPDPRNRRSIRPDEILATGGFWHVQGDRESLE